MPVLRLSPKPLSSLSVNTNGLTGAGALLGKSVTDLQSDIAIGKGAITGTLKYVTGYTGFSGDTKEQSGHYLATHCTVAEGTTVTAELVGGAIGHAVTLDADGILISRLDDSDMVLVFKSYVDGVLQNTQTFDLSGLALEGAE